MIKEKFSVRLTQVFINIISLLFIITSGCNKESEDSCSESAPVPESQAGWTVMIYGDGDNNLESYLLEDVEEMKAGFVDGQGINLIVLADRSPEPPSSTDGFGKDFTDARLYKITHGTATRISGGTVFPDMTLCSSYEANMGDPAILKKFIRYCKAYYPADHYALVLWNHGSGARKKMAAAYASSESATTAASEKAVCIDDTDGDMLYTAEITDNLTANESIDLLGFDACLMGTAEVAYQYRPDNGGFCADYMVASPASVWGYGWDYEAIFARLKSGGGDNGKSIEVDTVDPGSYESYYDPASLTADELGAMIVEEQYDYTFDESGQTMSCYDLSQAAAVKTAVDGLAVQLADESEKGDFEDIRGSGTSTVTMCYFENTYVSYWSNFPYFDLYDLCERTNADTSEFSTYITGYANDVMTAVGNMIICSFGGSNYTGYNGDFANQKNGLSIFFPNGDEAYMASIYWAYQWWYNALTTSSVLGSNYLYGNLAWCIDSADQNNGTVENWFELLDSWFDVINASGGYNRYSY